MGRAKLFSPDGTGVLFLTEWKYYVDTHVNGLVGMSRENPTKNIYYIINIYIYVDVNSKTTAPWIKRQAPSQRY